MFSTQKIWLPLCTSYWQGHSLSVSVKASEVPRHRGKKYWVKSPPLGTKLYKPKSRVCRIGCDSLVRPWRALLNENNVAASYENNLCQMFKLPSGVKMRSLTIQMWISRTSPIVLGEEMKVSAQPASQGNTSWWIWGDYPCLSPAMPEVVGGFKWLGHCSDQGRRL